MAYTPPKFDNWSKGQRQAYNKFVRSLKGKGTTGANKPAPVNQNPQPPNATQTQQNNAAAQASSSTSSNAQSQTGGYTYTPPEGTTAPTSSYKPETGRPDPRDAQYWNDVTKLYFDRNQQLNTMNYEDTLRSVDYNTQKSDLAREEPRARLANKVAASRQGNLYSSTYDYGQALTQEDYLRRNTDTQRSYERENTARAMMRNALENGYTINEAAALAAAADRKAQDELNQPTPPSSNTPTTPTQPQGPTLEEILKQFFGKPKKGKPKGKGKGKK
jgi:hypothetical protein